MRRWNLFNKYLAFILRLSIVLLYFWNILSLNLIRRNNKLEYELNIFLKGQVVIRLIKKNLEKKTRWFNINTQYWPSIQFNSFPKYQKLTPLYQSFLLNKLLWQPSSQDSSRFYLLIDQNLFPYEFLPLLMWQLEISRITLNSLILPRPFHPILSSSTLHPSTHS